MTIDSHHAPDEQDEPDYANPLARPLAFYDGNAAAERAAKNVEGDPIVGGLRDALTEYLIGCFEESFRTAELNITPPDYQQNEWCVSVSVMGDVPSAVWSLDNALTRLIADIADPVLFEPDSVNAVAALADMLERHAVTLRKAAKARIITPAATENHRQ